MRPIDADALLAKWNDKAMKMVRDKDGAIPIDFSAVISALILEPTLDDLLLKGHWNVVEFDEVSRRITIECSECGMVEEMTVMAYGFGHNFCHICGADMRGGGEDA